MFYKAIEWFCWGLFMGAGWAVAGGLIDLLRTLLSHAH